MIPIRDHERSGIVPIMTITIIIVNVVVFIQELLAADLNAFIQQWAVVPTRLSLAMPTSLVTLVTSQFLHGGFLHILSNMLYLRIFGDNIEAAFGRVRFLLFYLAAGIVAALVQLPFIAGSPTPMLGASGAVAGCLGAYWAFFPRHRIDTIIPLGFFWTTATLPAGGVLLFWFVAQLLNGTATVVSGAAAFGGVAFFAHAGGFVFGWLVARTMRRRRRTTVRVVGW